MKKLIVLMVIILMLMLTGCQMPEQGDYYEKLTGLISESVEAQQAGNHQIVEAIGEVSGIPPDDLAEIHVKLEKIDQYVDMAQEKAMEAAKAYDASDDQIGGWLKAGEIVAGIFSPKIALLIAAGTAAWGATNKKKLTISDKKYEAHKRAGERIMRSSEPFAPNEVYAMIGEERQKVGL